MKNLRETDVQDSEGRVVISPGLKVRHKDSQYEYTVDSVVSDDSGKHVVILNLPEEPRFDTTVTGDTGPAQDALLSDLADKEVIYEVDPSVVVYEPTDSDSDPEAGVDYLAVPEEEFEKDYEVN